MSQRSARSARGLRPRRSVSRQQNIDNELIYKVSQQGELSKDFLVLMALSGVLAAVAFASSSIPVLLGAMIVAPVMSPLALFIFAFCGGQPKLAWRGLGTALTGLVVATLTAMATAYIIVAFGVAGEASTIFIGEPLFEERVRPGWYSMMAAGAAGIAGTLAFARGKTDTLIGTVASLALVPAAAAGGIAFIEGDPMRALGGLVLLTMNLGLILATGMWVVIIARPGVGNGSSDAPGRDLAEEQAQDTK